jgi:putative PIN family toxin of toxin-antitoxin system
MTPRPRWVVDTNVLISAFLWQGTPGRVIELAASGEVLIFTSRVLLEELRASLAKKKLVRPTAATGLSAADIVRAYRQIATIVVPRRLVKGRSRDSDDDAVIACALAANADVIVSGDDDLLSLRVVEGIRVVTAAQATRTL